MNTDWESLRFINTAGVYKYGTLAWHLNRTESGTVRFNYVDEYAGDPVALTLPVASHPIEGPGGSLPPFFAGLLPEGHRLTVLRTVTKTSPDDELTLLLAIGADTPETYKLFLAEIPRLSSTRS